MKNLKTEKDHLVFTHQSYIDGSKSVVRLFSVVMG